MLAIPMMSTPLFIGISAITLVRYALFPALLLIGGYVYFWVIREYRLPYRNLSG